jgi:hypothetical protein
VKRPDCETVPSAMESSDQAAFCAGIWVLESRQANWIVCPVSGSSTFMVGSCGVMMTGVTGGPESTKGSPPDPLPPVVGPAPEPPEPDEVVNVPVALLGEHANETGNAVAPANAPIQIQRLCRVKTIGLPRC